MIASITMTNIVTNVTSYFLVAIVILFAELINVLVVTVFTFLTTVVLVTNGTLFAMSLVYRDYHCSYAVVTLIIKITKVLWFLWLHCSLRSVL